MQNKYSLAYAMAKDGQGIFSNADNAKGGEIVSPGPLVSGALAEAPSLSSMSLALTNAGLQLNGLSLSLGLVRNSVDALEDALSRLKAVDVEPSKIDQRSEQKTTTEVKSSASQDRSLVRDAMTLRDVKSLDPVAAFQQSFAAPAVAEKTTTQLREESSKSEERLSTTLKLAPVLGEDWWLQAKTHVMDRANTIAGESPTAVTAVKMAEVVVLPVISPVITGFFSGLGETIKTRVTGNLVDLTLGKLPGVAGKLFKSDGFKKDKSCCCAAAVQASPSSRRVSRRSSSARKKNTQPLKSQNKKTQRAQNKQGSQKKQASVAKPAATRLASTKSGGVMATLRGVSERFAKSFFPAQSNGFHAGGPTQGMQLREVQANSRKQGADYRQPAAGRGPGLMEALERGLVPLPSDGRMTALPNTQTFSHERSTEALPHAPKLPASGLSGAVSKLESSAARRLGPMRYVDTAMVVAEGIRNGDAKAVGAGLTTAGGAWAGASAGAAIGTLIFPGVGTAVGGAIGGLLGSEAGTWLGDKLFGSTDRLPAPGAVSKELNAARTDNVQVTLAPSIQITGVNPADAQQVVNQVIQALQFQCMPMVTDTLGIRRNAALADPSGGD